MPKWSRSVRQVDYCHWKWGRYYSQCTKKQWKKPKFEKFWEVWNIWNFPCFQQTWLNFPHVCFLGIFHQLERNNSKLEEIRFFVSKFLFHKYFILHVISIKIQSYSNRNPNIKKHVAWYTSFDFLHVSMCTWRSKTYKCDFIQSLVPISYLLYLFP